MSAIFNDEDTVEFIDEGEQMELLEQIKGRQNAHTVAGTDSYNQLQKEVKGDQAMPVNEPSFLMQSQE